MILTLAQRRSPHLKVKMRNRLAKDTPTHLERAFASKYPEDRNFFWANGVAEQTLQHPQRAPRLFKSFLIGDSIWGVASRTFTQEAWACWDRMLPFLKTMSLQNREETCQTAIPILALHSPNRARELMELHPEVDYRATRDIFIPLATGTTQQGQIWHVALRFFLQYHWKDTSLTDHQSSAETLALIDACFPVEQQTKEELSLTLKILSMAQREIHVRHGNALASLQARILKQGHSVSNECLNSWLSTYDTRTVEKFPSVPTHDDWWISLLDAIEKPILPSSFIKSIMLPKPDVFINALAARGVYAWSSSSWGGVNTNLLEIEWPSSPRSAQITQWLNTVMSTQTKDALPSQEWLINSAARFLGWTGARTWSAQEGFPENELSKQFDLWVEWGQWKKAFPSLLGQRIVGWTQRSLKAASRINYKPLELVHRSGMLDVVLASQTRGHILTPSFLSLLLLGDSEGLEWAKKAFQNASSETHQLLSFDLWRTLIQAKHWKSDIQPEEREKTLALVLDLAPQWAQGVNFEPLMPLAVSALNLPVMKKMVEAGAQPATLPGLWNNLAQTNELYPLSSSGMSHWKEMASFLHQQGVPFEPHNPLNSLMKLRLEDLKNEASLFRILHLLQLGVPTTTASVYSSRDNMLNAEQREKKIWMDGLILGLVMPEGPVRKRPRL